MLNLIFKKKNSGLPDIAQKWFCTQQEHMNLKFKCTEKENSKFNINCAVKQTLLHSLIPLFFGTPCIAISGYLWISLPISDNFWSSLANYGNLGQSWVISGRLCLSLARERAHIAQFCVIKIIIALTHPPKMIM